MEVEAEVVEEEDEEGEEEKEKNNSDTLTWQVGKKNTWYPQGLLM